MTVTKGHLTVIDGGLASGGIPPDAEFDAFPAGVRTAITTWTTAIHQADQAAAGLLALAKDSGIARQDVIAVSRRQLVRAYPGRRHGIPL